MRVSNVLVPVDFSPPSELAVGFGVALARTFHAKLTLLHVVSPMAASVDLNQTHRAVRTLNGLVSPEDQGDLDLSAITRIGAVDEEILSVIRENGVDFVVMGTHGRRFLGRVFIGSETEKMIRKLETPVLTVCHAPTGLNFGRILFATDLSEAAEHAFEFVVDLAQNHQSDLTIVHVLDGPINVGLIAANTLDELADSARAHGITTEAVLAHGHPADRILGIADQHNVDLIVLGIERKPFLERTLLGVTAERVIREAYVPVLSIPMAAEVGAQQEKEAS